MEAFEYIDSQCKLAMQLYAEGRGVTGPLGELFEKVYKYTDINMLYYLLESYYSIKYSENYLVVEFLSKMNVDGNDSLATVARLYYDTEEQSFTGFDLYTSE